MKPPKLFQNSQIILTIEGLGDFCVMNVYGATRWPSRGETELNNNSTPSPTAIRLYDDANNLIVENYSFTDKYLKKFNLHFVSVTNSNVDFKTKAQTIDAKMRAVNSFERAEIHEFIGYDS